ncbi:MAG: lytic transglycosylase domain-containing protein [Amaricoccus sp.]|uniref:lytic transglycosylase domain-containing protein n=1 Tax=Amaricoccus sp. TaxID=1872485 RepID=UPI0039E3CD55
MSHRSGPWPALALGLSLACLAAAPTARADSLEAGAATCERAIAGGAQRGHVPEGVLRAISLTETGRQVGGALRPWPWAINREGQGYWFATRDEALAFARASLADGRRSFDVGCFQINYLWHGANFSSLEAMFDPDTGADYAARFLTDLYAERGDWSLAAGAYHSQTPDKAEVYRARFDRILAGIGGQPLQVAALADAPSVVVPKKSRTRLKGPKIITLPAKGAAAEMVPMTGPMTGDGGGVSAALRASGAPQMVAELTY